MRRYDPTKIDTAAAELYGRWQGLREAGLDPHAAAKKARRVEAEKRAQQGRLALEGKR